MPAKKARPIAQEAYNAIAEAYAAKVDTKPHNAYYERPATLSLLPDVNGKLVMDAGCGPGVYSEWLVNHGARVVGIDANKKMVKLARQRLGGRAQILQANLEAPLDFLMDASYDLIICPLVMDYVKDWEPTFHEFYRVLKLGGTLVFSISHPFEEFDKLSKSRNYFEVEIVDYLSTGFGKPVRIHSYRRPLNEVINTLLRVGFILDQILEPLPTEQFKQANPEDYAELLHYPGFMCLQAVKGKYL